MGRRADRHCFLPAWASLKGAVHLFVTRSSIENRREIRQDKRREGKRSKEMRRKVKRTERKIGELPLSCHEKKNTPKSKSCLFRTKMSRRKRNWRMRKSGSGKKRRRRRRRKRREQKKGGRKRRWEKKEKEKDKE